MSVAVNMPQLGESVTEGTVTRWLKKEGEHVTVDEPLLEVSTDKVDTEIPSPAPPLAPPPPAPAVNTWSWNTSAARAPEVSEPAPGGAYPEPTPLLADGDSPYVTPLVRKLAAEHSVALDSVTGTGVGGRIR